MSSWLSCCSDVYITRGTSISLEDKDNSTFIEFSKLSPNKTINKVQKEAGLFLNSSSTHQKKSAYKNKLKHFSEQQKQKIFGASDSSANRVNTQRVKTSPLTVFSKIQKTHSPQKQELEFRSVITYKSQKVAFTTFSRFPILNKKPILQKEAHTFTSSEKSLKNTSLKEYEKHLGNIKKNQFFKETKHPIPYGEKDGQQSNQENEEESLELRQEENKIKKITRSCLATIINTATASYSSCRSLKLPVITALISHKPSSNMQKIAANPPKIPLPTIGIFALYYILTKQGIISDQTAYSSYKQEIDITHNEIMQAHRQRLEVIQENINKEQSVARWGVLSKFISWLLSFISVVTACILIFSGVGAIMGATILAAGLFSLTNSILEVTGGWNKIARVLPGKTNISKQKAMNIIKISVGVISLILGLITVIWGGFSHALRAMQSITQAITGALITGMGICIVGEAISSYNLYYSLAELKETERKLEKLFFKRKNLEEKADWDLDHIEQLFEDIAYALDLHKETALIDNAFYYS